MQGRLKLQAADGDVLAEKRQELASLVARVQALSRTLNPLGEDAAAAVPTWRAAYSDRTSALMAKFCALAYEHFEASELEASAMREKLAAGGFNLVATYDVNACTQGFLAVGAEFAVLAFRGTQDSNDWRVNLNAKPLPLSENRPDIRVHGGFLQAFRDVREEMERDLALHVPDDLGLYITGHSLGGALAQIASAAFARENLAACYTFGSPRVAVANFDYEVKCPHYRLVNDWDIVPGLPPPLWHGYLHSGDVRTLTRLGRPPLRRSRWGWAVPYQTVRALFRYVFKHRFFLIDEHMIWAYQEKLDAVAKTRGRWA